MVPVLVAMLVILGIAAATAGVVVMGLEGRGKRRAPKLADTMARAARSLNGDHHVGLKGRTRR